MVKCVGYGSPSSAQLQKVAEFGGVVHLQHRTNSSGLVMGHSALDVQSIYVRVASDHSMLGHFSLLEWQP